MNLKETLVSLKNELAELKTRIEADDAEAIARGVELKAEIEAKEKEIEAAEKKAALLNSIGEKQEEDKPMTGMEKFLEDAKSVDKSVKGWGVSAHIKAATDVVTSETISDYDRQVAPQPRRRAAADLFSNATISGNAITYFLQGAYEGTPAVTAEGAKKPQNSTSFSPVTLALSKIAAYIKETDEILLDNDFLASEVRDSLIYKVGTVEDAHVIGAIAGTSGILAGTYGTGSSSVAADMVDGILYGIRAVKQQSAYDASAIIMNPADFFTLLTAKDQNKQYYGGGYFQNTYGNGSYQSPYILWGVEVFESAAVTAGTALIAARQAVKVWRKGGLNVMLYEQNEDDALYNRVTLLGEERLAAAVTDLKGVFKLTAE